MKNQSCQLCGKTAQSANNRPKSLHKTKRLMKPNLQKWTSLMIANSGEQKQVSLLICGRCRRTIKALAPKAPAVAAV